MRQDDEVRDDILAEVDWDPRVKSTQIGVIVQDGVVTLHGTVGSYAEKLAAEDAAKRVRGVCALADEVKVKLPSSDKATNDEIADRIAHVLQWNASIPGERIKTEVRGGFVTLIGEVDWHYERVTAENIIAGVRGVLAVNNMIEVRPRLRPRDVTRAIASALHRNAKLETSNVKVDISGGCVTLNGEVKALYECKLVEDAAWAAPGVTDVVDKLRIV